ncbi:MAG: hypothetical protein LBF22_14555 [Deltaproteobacteria bacterium]|nr:hypothetical protein [Deltaproteobacteria bacterium]
MGTPYSPPQTLLPPKDTLQAPQKPFGQPKDSNRRATAPQNQTCSES